MLVCLRMVDPPDTELVMSPIIFNDFPLIWLGEEHIVFVYFEKGGQRVNKRPEITWTALDPSIFTIQTTSSGDSSTVTLTAAAVGETKLVATTASGHRAELEIRVADRDDHPIQWF